MKTGSLIDTLAQDAPLRATLAGALKAALIVGTGIAGLIFFLMVGFRHDIAAAAETTRFFLKFAVTVSLAAAATAAVLRVSRPGTRVGPTGWALAISPTILIVAVAVELIVLPEQRWLTSLLGSNAKHCMTLIPLLALGPLTCLLIALREGAPTNPGLAGALAGLAASGVAATFYAANCTDDSPLFVVVWYPLATSLVVLLGYVGGRRFLSW